MSKTRTYTIIVDGQTFGNVIDYNIAHAICMQFLAHRKSVLLKDNALRKTIARFIYGHKQ